MFKNTCTKALNVIKVVANFKWGCIVYGLAMDDDDDDDDDDDGSE